MLMFKLKGLYLRSRPFFNEYFKRSRVSLLILDQKISISQDASFVYYRIPKAANSTIFSSLYENMPGRTPTDMDELSQLKESYYIRPRQVGKKQLATVKAFTHFTFVRHPIKRFLSCYRDKIAGGEKSHYVNKWMKRDVAHDVTMSEFIDYLEQGGLYANAHWAPQVALVPNDISKLDFIGKVENIEEDWCRLCNELGIDWPLTHFAPHSTSQETSRGETPGLDSPTLSRLEALYRQDFECFDYSPPSEQSAE
ncbi:sulfotransferase family protein [Halomonas salipaludis]|uniref:Sulfotransferase family protein n=1 Tax=Halomonas salipaludis TaxID=2032625 RepID=A0A2A2F4D2_9GAMM|nr:sulfotransferase family protein [Halomonas salipaludis]PAU79455.1 hypothetical protein CK498_03565 [Halomonas salipaludis]